MERAARRKIYPDRLKLYVFTDNFHDVQFWFYFFGWSHKKWVKERCRSFFIIAF